KCTRARPPRAQPPEHAQLCTRCCTARRTTLDLPNCEFRTSNCELRAANFELRTANCELRTASCELRAAISCHAMTMSRRRRRRSFLKQVPAPRAVTLAAPSLFEAQTQPAAPAPGITAETLGAAQQVAGVSLPAAERESARPLVARNLGNIEAVRNV